MIKFTVLCFFYLSSHGIIYAQNGSTINGHLPGKQGSKIYINYKPPGLGGSKYSDSCIIDEQGKFSFISQFKEPVLALLRFDFNNFFEFFTDKEDVIIRPLYKGNEFDFSKVEAASLLNIQYTQYKKFIQKELLFTDSVYTIRERLRTEKKRDSMKLIEPVLQYADSLMLLKRLNYVQNYKGSEIIKSMVLYSKLMLHSTVDDVKILYLNLGNEGQQSVYGKAVSEFIQAKAGLKIGVQAPSFSDQLSPQGKQIKIENFQGKYLFIDFWAAWCIPCREENPALVKLYVKYKSEKFEMLGVSLDRDRNAWVNAIKKDGLLWPQVSDLKFWDNECVKLYGLFSLPFNVLLDTEGKILAINLTSEMLENKLTELVETPANKTGFNGHLFHEMNEILTFFKSK